MPKYLNIKYVEDVNGCHIWQGCKRGGYGIVWSRARQAMMQAHRFFYEEKYGEIPENIVLDHKCRNRACINLEHLEPVTQQENILRGKGIAANNSTKTHCPSGHQYSEENTMWYRGSRYCRICTKLKSKQPTGRKIIKGATTLLETRMAAVKSSMESKVHSEAE